MTDKLLPLILNSFERFIASDLQLILLTVNNDWKLALFSAERSLPVIQLKRQIIAIAFDDAVTAGLFERWVAALFKFSVIELPLLKPTHTVCAVAGQLPI